MPRVNDEEIIDWLMAGDPAVRWRVLRDLVAASPAEVAAERARVATGGWGALVLSKQDADATWGGGIYQHNWTSTFFSLLLLKEFGLTAQDDRARRAGRLVFDDGWREDGGLFHSDPNWPLPRTHASETCQSGMGLGMLSRFGFSQVELTPLRSYLLRQQMPDGGWNCQYPGATHASFHTTILVLEGLAEWETAFGVHPEVAASRRRGEEFLLVHRLLRSHSTGEVIEWEWRLPLWPGTWHYDVMRALDYLSASRVRDERMRDAIDDLQAMRLADGRWPRESTWPGKVWSGFEPAGEPGRWMTVRALTVLRAWGQGA